jgi:hypothetical protein
MTTKKIAERKWKTCECLYKFEEYRTIIPFEDLLVGVQEVQQALTEGKWKDVELYTVGDTLYFWGSVLETQEEADEREKREKIILEKQKERQAEYRKSLQKWEEERAQSKKLIEYSEYLRLKRKYENES